MITGPLILPARRALTDPAGPYGVVDRRHDGRERLLARFRSLVDANDYARSLRRVGALVEVRLEPTAEVRDEAA